MHRSFRALRSDRSDFGAAVELDRPRAEVLLELFALERVDLLTAEFRAPCKLSRRLRIIRAHVARQQDERRWQTHHQLGLTPQHVLRGFVQTLWRENRRQETARVAHP